jgi:hypothetical protein
MTTSLSVRRALASCILTSALAVGVSACGSSSSGASTTLAGSSVSSSNARYQARVNLAKCFRAHGINVPDPSPGGGLAGGGGGGVLRALQGLPQAQLQAAEQACQQYIKQAFPNANLSPAQQAQFRQAFVKWAQCMRSRGVNVPDPTTTGAGGFGLRRSLGSIDRNSPAFQSANTACASLRPQLGRGGPGGGRGA